MPFSAPTCAAESHFVASVWAYVRGVLTCALEAPMPLHSSLVRRLGIPPHCRIWFVHRICATHVTFSFSFDVPYSSHTRETHSLPAKLWTTWKRLGNSQMLAHACAGYDVQQRTGLGHSWKRGPLTTASSLSPATLDICTRGNYEHEKRFFHFPSLPSCIYVPGTVTLSFRF